VTDATRTRRSSLQAREAILAAAEAVFAVQGYAGATSRDLSRAAGVSESVIYRHFGSKSGLFASAVLAPFLRFLSTFSDTSARYLAQPLPDEAMMRLFVSELFDQLTVHRGALRSFLAAAEDLDDDTKQGFYRAFDDVMVRIGQVAGTEARVRNRTHRGLGSELNARIAVGTVLSLVVLDDWLLPSDDRRPSRDQLIERVCTILQHGT
jgi:AcrR family transcriptional regulator